MTGVSVIVPAFRAEGCIGRAVRSVLAQTYQEFEIIVISDDGRDYQAVLATQGIRDARLRFTTTRKIGAGPGVARNAGLDAAQYDIISNLDADDVYSANYLACMVPMVMTHGACTPAVRVIDPLTDKILPLNYQLNKDTPLSIRDSKRYCATYAPIMFNRRWCEARWPALHYGEDTLFWVLLLDTLPAIYFVAGAHYDYTFGKGSLSRPDEKDTHAQCERRNRMIEWLENNSPTGCNHDSRDFLKRWVATCNEMEAYFGYQLAELDVYLKELNSRLDTLFNSDEAVGNIGYS